MCDLKDHNRLKTAPLNKYDLTTQQPENVPCSANLICSHSYLAHFLQARKIHYYKLAVVCSSLESETAGYCFLFQDAPPAQGKGLQEVLQDCLLGIVFFVGVFFWGCLGFVVLVVVFLLILIEARGIALTPPIS